MDLVAGAIYLKYIYVSFELVELTVCNFRELSSVFRLAMANREWLTQHRP